MLSKPLAFGSFAPIQVSAVSTSAVSTEHVLLLQLSTGTASIHSVHSHARGIRLPYRSSQQPAVTDVASQAAAVEAGTPSTAAATAGVPAASLLQRRSSSQRASAPSGPAKLSHVTLGKNRKRFRPGAGPTSLPAPAPAPKAPRASTARRAAGSVQRGAVVVPAAPQLFAVGRQLQQSVLEPSSGAKAGPAGAASLLTRTPVLTSAPETTSTVVNGGAPVASGDFEEL